MKLYSTIVLVSFVLVSSAGVSGHEGVHPVSRGGHYPDPGRLWRFSNDAGFIRGSLMLCEDGEARIERLDGEVVSIPLWQLSDADRGYARARIDRVEWLNNRAPTRFVSMPAGGGSPWEPAPPAIAKFFQAFERKGKVRLSWDEKYLVVASNGLPDHQMMVGITAWNLQVPIAHDYSGDNAFRIPIKPAPAARVEDAPFLNAIALGVNGVPIFNPIKQDGRTDTLAAGELDKYGGHAGRGDDYHYHLAPVHLEKLVGKGKPVAFALDGYPIIPAPEKNGRPTIKLDELNGARGRDGSYAYYATSKPPYIMPGFRGVVDWSLQPRGRGVRPFTRPLRGAKITGFTRLKDGGCRLSYDYRGETWLISWRSTDSGGVEYVFTDPAGKVEKQSYGRRQARGRGTRAGGQDDRRPPRDSGSGGGARKPRIADTIKANIYADNTFTLYINGELVAVDSIPFIPHNVISVDYLPRYPMTIAVLAKDNADPRTGMEYANTSIGDAGFILKLGDGTVSNARWKAKKFSWGPLNRDTKNPKVKNISLPKSWYAVDFDDSKWGNAREFTEQQVGPKEPFFEHDFKGARFIWSDDLALDNTVVFRFRVESPPDGKDRPDFSDLTNEVPAGGGGRSAGGGRRQINDDELDSLIDDILGPGGAKREGRGGGETRQPWIVVHADELDTDGDGVVTGKEMQAEVARAFSGYDANRDGSLSGSEIDGPGKVRSALGGFIRGHAKEIDRDGDGVLSRREVVDNASRMFDKADRDGDSRLTAEELEQAKRRPGDRLPKPRRNENRKPPPRDRGDDASVPLPRVSRLSPDPGSPNFVLILMDDMGWRGMGFSGNEFVETPNTDRLAHEGIIFSQAYASAPNCAPTRACLMSGQYTPRHGVFTVSDERHSPGSPAHRIIASESRESMAGDVVTIAEALKTKGYRTAAFGMWNLGRGRGGPATATGQGFDVYKKPQDLGFEKNSYRDSKERYLTDAIFDEGIRFIEGGGTRPFFLYLPTHAIHEPFEPKKSLLAKYERKITGTDSGLADPTHAAMVEAVDQNVGRLMSALRRLELADNTMVIFTSDNGGVPAYTAPLKGSKGSLYEGGIRVPACVWWSGIKRPGRTASVPISSIDFYPTLLEAAGLGEPQGHKLDGESLLPVLEGSGKVTREALFWHFPCYVGRSAPSSAIRQGDFKLIEFYEDRHVELYDLESDPGEKNDLAIRNPLKTEELREALSNWRRETGAPVPTEKNPAYDSSSARRGRGGGRGKKNPKADKLRD